MPGRDPHDHWDDEEAAQRRYEGRYEGRYDDRRADERRADDRREWDERRFDAPYEGPHDGDGPPRHVSHRHPLRRARIGPTGMMNHSHSGMWGASGRYFEDEMGRASYGGWDSSEPSYGPSQPSHRPQRLRDAQPDPARRPDYRTEGGYTREDQEAIGGPYTDYGHAMGGYGAGGGYTPTPDEGVGRERRSWRDPGSWFGRPPEDRAYVEGPHRGRGPKGYTRSGERIREDVSDRLTEDPHLDPSDIEVAVDGTEVTLNGFVDSRGAKRRAEDMAEDVTGVTHVQNNLRVRPRPGTAAAVTDPRLLAIAEGRDPAKAGREAAEAHREAEQDERTR